MANAKLHMICGNCGQNDMFDYHISNEINDDTDEEYQVVYIGCNNCGTLHILDDNAELENQNKEKTKKVCENKVDGNCPLHNLFCKYPDCEC